MHTWVWIRRQEKFYVIYYFEKIGGSQLWTSCELASVNSLETLGVFFVESDKDYSRVYKKQDSLANPNQSFLKFQRGSIDAIKNRKWRLRKRMPVCSNLVISLFKSKTVSIIYIENLFLYFVFSVSVTTRKNAKKKDEPREKEAEDPNFSPTDSEVETNASQTTSEEEEIEEEEEEEAVEKTSNTPPVVNHTTSSSKRLVQIYKYIIDISYGKGLHNLKK